MKKIQNLWGNCCSTLKKQWASVRNQQLEALIFRLSRPDALLHLAFFGLVTGFLAGGVIVIFRLLVENIQGYMLPGDNPESSNPENINPENINPENYEALSAYWHFFLPVIASLLLALLFYKYSKGIRVLGIARVMERVAYHQGYLTLRGFILQFLGAAIAIIGGHSVGREGPHAHLGASISSLFGQLFKLPSNTIRTLVACGAAAGISASFNTPLAGVIFALEVIMMEYALNSFIPVMLAALAATVLSNIVLGADATFAIENFHTIPLEHLPVVLVLGLVVGTCAALFNHTLTLISMKTQQFDIWWRMIVAGFAVGALALIQPEILGIGYDTVNASLAGEFTLSLLLLLAFLKILATSLSVGLGIPGGMIGPAFFIGSTMGGAVWLAAYWVLGDGASQDYIGSYALLGMGAMMGASLQAPLAALTAIVELTYSPEIIMPGMLAIIVAQLTASELFNKTSLFVTMLRSNGLDFSVNPVVQVLRGVGVASVLDHKLERHPPVITREDAEFIIKADINWIIINDTDGTVHSAMPTSELAKFLAKDLVADLNNQSSTHSTMNSQLDSPVDASLKKDFDSASDATFDPAFDPNRNPKAESINQDASEPGIKEEQEKQEEQRKPEDIDLLQMPAKRLSLSPISLQSNLMQAHQLFESGAELLFVVFREKRVDANSRIYGVITPKAVERAYIPAAT